MLRSHSFPHNVQRSQSKCVWFQWSCYWHSHLHSKQLSPVETSRRSLICCGGVSLCQFIKCVYAVCFPLLFARDGIRYRLMIVVVRSNASHMTWAVFVSFHPRVIWAGHVRVGGQRFFWKLPKTNLIIGGRNRNCTGVRHRNNLPRSCCECDCVREYDCHMCLLYTDNGTWFMERLHSTSSRQFITAMISSHVIRR